MKKKKENRKSAAEAAQQAGQAAKQAAEAATQTFYELVAFEEKYGALIPLIDRYNELTAKYNRLCREEQKAYKRWFRFPIETIAKK